MNQKAITTMARKDPAAGGELHRRLQLSLLLRVIMVTFLLGATAVIQARQTPSLIATSLLAIYILSGVTYFVTLVSALALRYLRRLTALSYAQIGWDIIFVTTLIYVTGGNESIFSFLYLLAVIVGGTLQYRLGSFLAAFSGTLCYGLLLAAMEAGWLRPLVGRLEPVGWIEILYLVSINLAAMFGMAVLSTYLTEKLRVTGNELQETMRHRDTLEALNDNIVRSLSSGLLTLGLDGRITSFNLAAESITGVPVRSAIGEHCAIIFPELVGILSLDPALRAAKASRHEIVWISPHGKAHNLEFRISPLRAAGEELVGTMVIMNDITEIRQMEERLRKADRLAAVGQLAAGIAHEIRNPLASISGSIQVLDNDLDLDPVSHRLMRIVIRETDRLNSLITHFLLYARPEPRTIQEVRLDRLIPEMIEVYKNRTDMPSAIRWKIAVDPDLMITSDPKLIEQVLWNLLHNAVQAMPEGGDLIIRAFQDGRGADPAGRAQSAEGGENEDRGRDGGGPGAGDMEPGTRPRGEDGPPVGDDIDQPPMVVIEVEDTGCGIPAEFKDKVFDPFFTTRDGGTGLGLSTVYRIIEAMQGSISVEDGEQMGTRFVVRIPVRFTGDPGAPYRASADQAAGNRGK